MQKKKNASRIPVFTVPDSQVRVTPESKPEENLNKLARALLALAEQLTEEQNELSQL